MMNSNRHVLRATHNRLPFKDITSEKILIPTKTKLSTHCSYQTQQENLLSRPILTAARSIKKPLKEYEDENRMLISPMVVSIHQPKQTPVQENKTREQLEQDLIELPDYRQSIFEHLKAVEHLYAPKVNFMEHQSDINSAMRTILIDWLIEVSDEYKLNDETLFLAVQYVDRFLSTVNVTRSKLQLLGTTCMYVAAKYEEMYPPALDEFAFITDNTYETKHILRMEQILMKMLNFSLSGPSCYTFLQYYCTCLKTNDEEYHCLTVLSNYLCTLSLLQDRPFSSYRTSMIAASCLFYANRLLNSEVLWSDEHIRITSYRPSDLNGCVSALDDLYRKSFHQDETSSSVLRRYLKKKTNHPRLTDLIHQSSTLKNVEDDDDDILDLTLDEMDEDHV